MAEAFSMALYLHIVFVIIQLILYVYIFKAIGISDCLFKDKHKAFKKILPLLYLMISCILFSGLVLIFLGIGMGGNQFWLNGSVGYMIVALTVVLYDDHKDV